MKFDLLPPDEIKQIWDRWRAESPVTGGAIPNINEGMVSQSETPRDTVEETRSLHVEQEATRDSQIPTNDDDSQASAVIVPRAEPPDINPNREYIVGEYRREDVLSGRGGRTK